jgi:hypothetical protein
MASLSAPALSHCQLHAPHADVPVRVPSTHTCSSGHTSCLSSLQPPVALLAPATAGHWAQLATWLSLFVSHAQTVARPAAHAGAMHEAHHQAIRRIVQLVQPIRARIATIQEQNGQRAHQVVSERNPECESASGKRTPSPSLALDAAAPRPRWSALCPSCDDLAGAQVQCLLTATQCRIATLIAQLEALEAELAAVSR